MRTKLIARTLFTTLAAAGLIQVAASAFQTAPPQVANPPAAGQGASANPAAAAPRPALPADQTAYSAAVAMTDPAAKLAALRKFQSDFPKSASVNTADNAILDTLIASFPDRSGEISTAVDKVVANIPAAFPADLRLSQIATIATKLLDKQILLDKVESLLAGNIDTILSDQVKEQEKARALTRSRALELQGRLHYSKGDTNRAEREFREALTANPALTTAPVFLARIDAKKGNDKAALASMMSVAALTKLKPEDDTFFRELYKKVNGNDTGIDEELDHAYKAKNPAVAEKYKKTPARTNRVVLAEMFTGSGCPPCVAADLALDAVLERYNASEVIALAYHEHIPLPDPMVVAGARPRFAYYAGTGVPTFVVDGAVVPGGGGSRENAAPKYKEYVGLLDRAVEVAPRAAVSARATSDGGKIKVSATVSNVDAAAKDVRVHIVLAEQELRFIGENNIRLHTMVVRGIAGETQTGFAVNPSGETTVEATFDLEAIKADVTKQINDEIARLRAVPSNASRVFAAENQAMIKIDPSKLSVVAFVQDGAKSILQAVRVDLKK